MLVLSREVNQKIIITCGEKTITLMVIETNAKRTRIGIEADRDVIIHREEIQRLINDTN